MDSPYRAGALDSGQWAVKAQYEYSLELENVTLRFANDPPVLQDCSLRVRRSETKVILGRSGAGKSTILKLALGLLRPNAGRVRIFGKDITEMSDRDMKSLRHRVGMVFQGGALFDSMSVAENVGFCMLENHHFTMEEAEPVIRKRLAYVGLEEAFHLMPSELSGGMTKRAAVARAVMCQPELMLYDEATSGLDPIATRRVNRLINRLRDDFHVSSVVVTHILRDALTVADSVAMLHEGEIHFDGSPEELRDSADPFVQDFISEKGV